MQPNLISQEAVRKAVRVDRIHGDVSHDLLLRERRRDLVRARRVERQARASSGSVRARLVLAVRAYRARHASL